MSNKLELFDNKIVILYILDNSSMPLTTDQIAKFCDEFEDITYFDICIYLEDLKSNGYIKEIHEENNVLYSPTKEGVITLRELLELIPGVNLYNLKKMVNKNMVEVKTEYAIDTNIIPIKDGNDELINITMYAGDKEQAKNISKNWANNSEKIYTTLLEMMTKEE